MVTRNSFYVVDCFRMVLFKGRVKYGPHPHSDLHLKCYSNFPLNFYPHFNEAPSGKILLPSFGHLFLHNYNDAISISYRASVNFFLTACKTAPKRKGRVNRCTRRKKRGLWIIACYTGTSVIQVRFVCVQQMGHSPGERCANR